MVEGRREQYEWWRGNSRILVIRRKQEKGGNLIEKKEGGKDRRRGMEEGLNNKYVNRCVYIFFLMVDYIFFIRIIEYLVEVIVLGMRIFFLGCWLEEFRRF